MKIFNLSFKIIVVAFLFVSVLFTSFGFSKNPKSVESIEYFHFSYSVGYYKDASISFDLSRDKQNNKYVGSFKDAGISDKNATKFYPDEKFVNDLIALINKNKLVKWDKFHKSDKNVLDGDSFSFSVKLGDGRYISASGYEAYPSNYGEVRNAILNLFKQNMNK